MAYYPSSAIENARDVIAGKQYLPSILILSDLSRRKLPLNKKIDLVRRYLSSLEYTDEDIVNSFLTLEQSYVTGREYLAYDQYRLGVGPDGRYRHEEYLMGRYLESYFQKRFFRYEENDGYDYVSNKQTFDLLGPIPPYYFSYKDFYNSVNEHLLKEGLDWLVVCTLCLRPKIQSDIECWIEQRAEYTDKNILLVNNTFYEEANIQMQMFEV